MISGKNFIGNQRSGSGNIMFKTIDPVLNLENNVEFFEAATEEIDRAVELAEDAYKTYQNISGQEKGEFLHAIADEIEALGEELVDMYCKESGLPKGRAMGERGRTIFQLRSFADLVKKGQWVDAHIDTAQPERTPVPKSDIRKMMVPLGPVVVFGASNFPLAYSTAGGDTASALAAGCPVIVKSHPMHAGTGELVASAIIKAAEKTNMPNGVFSNLNSKGIEVGVHLVQHPKVKAVGFTGSIKGGRALYDLAAKREEPIPVFAEMGSVNPVIFLPKALEKRGEALAKTYASSVTLGTGQFCTNPGLLFGIKGSFLDRFISKLSEEIILIEPGNMLHPNIAGAYELNKKNALSQQGLELVAEYDAAISPNVARQAVTTVSGITFLQNPALHQEVFGPFTMVVQCEDKEQLEAIILKLEGQLTGTVISEDSEISFYKGVIDAIKNRVGRIIFNGVPTGVEVCPAMVHGGPYPASTDSRFTAVGVDSIKRWVRPFSYQDWPDNMLPDALKNSNPLHIIRRVNDKLTTDTL